MAPLNPLISGFAPDPTILHHNNTFYIINSSFHLFPGLPIYSSPHIQGPYTHVSNALSRRSQLAKLSLLLSSTTIWPPNEEGENMLGTGGLYAPTLRFHAGNFYLVCTNVVHSEGINQDEMRNFILTATNIEGEWSDPVYFDFHGIDPSLFWDEDGKCYVQGSASPGPATRINQFEVDLKTGKKMSEEKTIWEGVIKFYPEGPHLYKKDGWYYLMIAEGGTHEGHMIEMARARNVWGPYEARDEGAILPPAKRGERVQYTGHGDLVHDGGGRWWAVCLGVRKMGDGGGKRYIMGRETFLTAAEWGEGDWPKIFPVKENLEGTGREVSKSGGEKIQVKGTADLVFLRDPVEENYQISGDGNAIKMKADVGDFRQWKKPVSFVGRRQRLLVGEAYVNMKIGDAKSNIKAGFAVHKDEHRFAQIYYDGASTKIVFEVLNAAKKISRTESREVEFKGGLSFKIVYAEDSYELSFETGSSWSSLGLIDTAELSGPDFVGPVIGPFAVDDGEGSTVEFEDFKVD